MTMKSMIKSVKTAFGGSKKSKRSRTSSTKTTDTTPSDLDWSSWGRNDDMDMSFSESDFSSGSDYEHAFFRNELLHLQQNTAIRRVVLQDFIQRFERDDLLALGEILATENRHWKVVKFIDTVEVENYRRWRFRKENVRRVLDQLPRFPVIFEEHIKMDMDDMPASKIASLLKDIQRDVHVRSLSLDGFLRHQDIDAVVGSLVQLLDKDHRRWKKIVLRCSFDGEEFDEWNRKIQLAKKQLGEITASRGIPIVLSVC